MKRTLLWIGLAAIDGIRQMQNQTVGVGGNMVLVTSDLYPQKGIAYRCGPAG